MDIIVKKMKDGKWKVWLADNEKICEIGKTKTEAIGNFMLATTNITGIVVLER